MSGESRILGLGATQVVTAPDRVVEWVDGKGFRTVKNYHGKKILVHRAAKDLMSRVDSIRIVEKGAYATMEATTTDESEVVQVFGSNNLNVYWELDSSTLEKDLRTHKFLDALGADKAEKLAIADKAIDEGTAQDILTAGTDAQIDAYIKLRLTGVESYVSQSYVVRKVSVCGSSSALRASFDGVMEVTKSDPSAGKAVNTNSRAGKPKFTVPAGEWLKMAPTVREIGKGKFHIVEEWWWSEKWSKTLYTGGTGVP